MRRRAPLGVFLSILSLWLQILAPAAQAAMGTSAPFSVICHHAPSGGGGGQPAPSDGSGCDRCTLCHATLSGLGGAPAPELATPRGVVVWALAWTLADPAPRRDDTALAGRPRGPPAA